VGIQFAMLNVASSAIVAVLMASDLNDMLDTLMSIRHSPDSSQLEALNHEYLEKVVLERTLRILSNSTARSSQMPLGSAYRITQAAQALIESSPEEPLTVMTLCQDLGVSRASLQRCFLQIHGVAPLAYLRMRRLNCARRALKAARGTSVTVTGSSFILLAIRARLFAPIWRTSLHDTRQVGQHEVRAWPIPSAKLAPTGSVRGSLAERSQSIVCK
jgi:AraC-like DNA-binding protein